jgi:tRNA/rRNA methyltransferase
MPPRASIRFVLVRPSNALNIGAAARAMANFGLTDLVAVEPYARRWRDARSSRYGSELLRRARRMSLEEALADRDLVLATGSTQGRAFRRSVVALPSVSKLRGKRVAILFGSERDGLSNDDLSHCRALIRIPTAPDAPSINLGQAAALVAYELSRSGLTRALEAPALERPDGAQLRGLTAASLKAMKKTGVNRHLPEAERRRRVREGFSRWSMSRADAAWLRGLLERLTR